MERKNHKGSNALSDEKIIEMYFERNELAISETDDKYGNYLKVIGYNILSDIWESDECVNDTYFQVWNKIPPTRPTIFQAFISKIMRDVSISRYRKRQAVSRIPSELLLSLDELSDAIVFGASTEEDAAIGVIADIINEFLKELTKR